MSIKFKPMSIKLNPVEAISVREEVKTVGNSTSVVKLWKKRSLEKIEKEMNEKLLEILNSDTNTHELIACMK